MNGLEALQEQLAHHKKTLRSVDESIKRLSGGNRHSSEVGAEKEEPPVRDAVVEPPTPAALKSSSNRVIRLSSTIAYNNNNNATAALPNSSVERNRREVISESNSTDRSLKRKIHEESRPYKRTVSSNSRPHDANMAVDDEDDTRPKKLTVQSSVVSSSMPIKSKEDLIKIQNKFSGSEQRNKRIFGVILGTLRQFKSEDQERSSTSQAQHRKELEKKIEVKKIEEKKKIIEEKKKLEEEKYKELRNIEILEEKIRLTEEFETWKKNQLKYKKFIRTKSKPFVFFLPKELDASAQQLLNDTVNLIEEQIAKKYKETEYEIQSLNVESAALNKTDIPGGEPGEKRLDSENKENKKATEKPDAEMGESSDSEMDEEKNTINVRIGDDDEEDEAGSPGKKPSGESAAKLDDEPVTEAGEKMAVEGEQKVTNGSAVDVGVAEENKKTTLDEPTKTQ